MMKQISRHFFLLQHFSFIFGITVDNIHKYTHTHTHIHTHVNKLTRTNKTHKHTYIYILPLEQLLAESVNHLGFEKVPGSILKLL